MAMPTAMSWVWWARHTAAIGAGALGIWEKANAADNTQAYFIFKNNTAQLWLTVRKNNTDINFNTADNFLLADSLWHQYGITFITDATSSRCRFYRDGRFVSEPATQAASSTPSSPHDGPVLLWRSPLFNTSMTVGMGDSFMIYRRRLDDADLRMLYTEAFTGYPTLLQWEPTPMFPSSGVAAAAPRRRVYVY